MRRQALRWILSIWALWCSVSPGCQTGAQYSTTICVYICFGSTAVWQFASFFPHVFCFFTLRLRWNKLLVFWTDLLILLDILFLLDLPDLLLFILELYFSTHSTCDACCHVSCLSIALHTHWWYADEIHCSKEHIIMTKGRAPCFSFYRMLFPVLFISAFFCRNSDLHLNDLCNSSFSQATCSLEHVLATHTFDTYSTSSKFVGKRCIYYANCVATFQIRLCSGDIHPNPGPNIESTPTTQHFIRNNLNCVLLNARSLGNKLFDLQVLVTSECLDILCITETWLDNSIHDGEILPVDYQNLRNDRNRNGGGVLFACRSDLHASRLQQYEIPPENSNSKYCEILWSQVMPRKNQKKILFGTLYRPPSSPLSKFCDALDYSFQRISPHLHQYQAIILTGDFNLQFNVDGASDDLPIPSNQGTFDVLELTASLGLSQLVTFPTRRSTNHRDSILDLGGVSLRVALK